MIDFKPTPIEKNGMRVLTTAQLAEAYGTTEKIISQNFNRNKKRYIEGKHFYCLKGKTLREFKANPQFEDLPSNLNTLYLWAERGALLHAKSINTDEAWVVYEFLLDTYFRAKEINNSHDERIYKKLEALEQKIDALEKKSGDIAEDAVKTLIPCFYSLDGKIESVAKKIIRAVSGNVKLLAVYIDYRIKKLK